MIWNKAVMALLGWSTTYAPPDALVLDTLPSIESPSIPLLDNVSPLAMCLKHVVQEQAPENLFADDEVLLTGPAIRSDASPRGSVIELVFVGKKSPQWPGHGTYITLSAWLETSDNSLWKEVVLDEQAHFQANAFSNPVKVFQRVGLQFIFDLDLSLCDPLLK